MNLFAGPPDDASGQPDPLRTADSRLGEEQSELGFIDASIVGLFRTQKEATAVLKSNVAEARGQGLLVCGDPGTEPEWEVSWNIEPHPLQ